MLKLEANGRVTGAEWIGTTPNNGGTFPAPPKYIVEHYTAGPSGKGSAKWLMGGDGQNHNSSAHFVVDRDGHIWQLADVHTICWHAGKSSWRGLNGMNKYSIGIEIANLGYLVKQANGSFLDGFGNPYKGEDPVHAWHKQDIKHTGYQYWEPYPAVQLAAVKALTACLIAGMPSIKEVVGHEDISPGRKLDPGPAFPLAAMQALINDNVTETATSVTESEEFVVTADALNVRQGPNKTADLISWSPLVKGSVVKVLQDAGDFSYIEYNGKNGWVADRYLAHK